MYHLRQLAALKHFIGTLDSSVSHPLNVIICLGRPWDPSFHVNYFYVESCQVCPQAQAGELPPVDCGFLFSWLYSSSGLDQRTIARHMRDLFFHTSLGLRPKRSTQKLVNMVSMFVACGQVDF